MSKIIDDLAFELDIKVILDILEEDYNINFYSFTEKNSILNNVKLFHKDCVFDNRYLYVIKAEDFNDLINIDEGLTFVIVGEVLTDNNTISTIVLEKEYNYIQVFDFIQSIYDKVNTWVTNIQTALNNGKNITYLCEISLSFFGNPILVHDEQFYVISCPKWLPGMSICETEQRSGRKMLPLSTINDFKVDREYNKTFKTKGSQIFPPTLLGFQVLYVNLKLNSRFEGRLCIHELQSKLKSIHFIGAEYLAKIIVMLIGRQSFYRDNFLNSYDDFFTDVLQGKSLNQSFVCDKLNALNWEIDDKYIVSKLAFEYSDYKNMSTEGTINYIESNIEGSYAFLYNTDIVIIINLSIGKRNRNEFFSQLSYILREGLFKAGMSRVFNNFYDIRGYYKQACIAYEYGKKSDSTEWYFEFEKYAFNFICDNSYGEMGKELISSEKVLTLKKYDEKNETSLYNTLYIYLKNDKNIMKTSRELFIHRSTLFYRLERIKKLTNIDYEDFISQMYILFSYFLLENKD